MFAISSSSTITFLYRLGVYLWGLFLRDKSLDVDSYTLMGPKFISTANTPPLNSSLIYPIDYLSYHLDSPLTPRYVQMELQIFFPTPGSTWVFLVDVYNNTIHLLKLEIQWPSLSLFFHYLCLPIHHPVILILIPKYISYTFTCLHLHSYHPGWGH